MVRGAGRGFSIIPAGFGCEVGMDAWVGGCSWGELYSVVVCEVLPWLLKYINYIMYTTSNMCKSL